MMDYTDRFYRYFMRLISRHTLLYTEMVTGAAIIHVHVRNLQDESPSTDFRLFEEVVQGLRAETDLIIQISTGGRAGMSYEQRCKRLRLTPEMASLTTGSVNFPNSVYANSPELIEKLAADVVTGFDRHRFPAQPD